MQHIGYYDKVTIKCEIEDCDHVSYIMKCSAIQNIKKNGKYVCMSCAQNGGWTCKLSDLEKDILLGSLLGDATIVHGRTKKYQTAIMQFEHSVKQKSYVNWKYEKLSRLATSEPYEKNNNGFGDRNIRFDSKCHSCFYPLYDLVTKAGKKTVSYDWLQILVSPISLAVWYMDDGSIDKNGSCRISTDGFSESEVESICDWLRSYWGIECNPRLHCKKYYQTALTAKGRDRLFELISEHIIPSMRYKLGESNGLDCGD